jgi:hypothetical protein
VQPSHRSLTEDLTFIPRAVAVRSDAETGEEGRRRPRRLASKGRRGGTMAVCCVSTRMRAVISSGRRTEQERMAVKASRQGEDKSFRSKTINLDK